MSDAFARHRPEVWLPVPGYEGLYEVSNLGRARRIGEGGRFTLILSPTACQGYLVICLSKDGVARKYRMNRLVLEAFCGPPPFAGAQAAHNDGCKTNNALTNLRWASNLENQADIDRHGRRCRGEDVFGSKLTEEAVRAIRRDIDNGMRNRPIAQRFQVSVSTVHLIRHRKIWRHVA